MKRVILYIQQRLSLRLGLQIILIITVIFSVVFDFLFYRSKQYVRQVAIERANQLLDNTVVRINGIMDQTETVTNYVAAVSSRNLYPDSLLSFTRRVVINHDFLIGFAISMEPYFFPEMGRYFSAYTLRQDDTITTVREGPFEYFDKIWYSSPRSQGAPCWVDAFDDYNEGTLSARDILTSYCCPMRDANGKFIGSVTASLTLKWLSEAFTGIKPYHNSSAIMVGRDGTYLVHPDTAKLYNESIFSDAAPEAQHDIDILGKAMLAGRSGMTQTIVDGNEAYIFYRPLERTGWSIAIVCPASDVFSRYNRLLYTVWIIVGIGLLLLLLFCYQTVRKAVSPLRQLAQQARHISDGYFDEPLPPSDREDSVGRLSNSFSMMQRSLQKSVNDIRTANSQLSAMNSQLSTALQLKMDIAKQKQDFVLDMTHQIRTPLNVINGFAQVLSANFHEFPEEEVADIISRMKSSSVSISHIATMLAAKSASDVGQKPKFRFTDFSCNALCREAVASIILKHPETVDIRFVTNIPDSQTICTDRRNLLLILSELLNNANKFTMEGSITLEVKDGREFVVSDTGVGIPEVERKRIFTPFMKLDMFNEGVGLGLPFCQYTVRLLGGEISLDPDYNQGSRFIITFAQRVA